MAAVVAALRGRSLSWLWHAPQLDALKAAGCSIVFREHRSGADRDRPELARAIAAAGKGDVLVVVRLDRLARSVRHLLEVIDALRSKGAAFRSLGDPVDTSTPQGVFTIQILGAVAELERQLIASRTKAGIAAAVARGSRPGNPGLRAKDPRAITKIARARREGHTGRVVATVDAWLPTVRRLRPKTSWGEIVKELNNDSANTGGPWNVERLKRSMGHDLSCEIGASREAGTHICENRVIRVAVMPPTSRVRCSSDDRPWSLCLQADASVAGTVRLAGR